MAGLALKGQFSTKALAGVKQGCLSVVYTKTYATDSDRKINLAAYKRGTGGRSSFNGIVCTVFGCSGFVGRYVCNKLGKIGTQMILPYRGDHYDVARLKVCGDLGQVLFQPFHLQDDESIEKAIRYSNVVVNLVGREYETKNFSFKDVHEDGARRIARACRKAGVERLIHLSYLNSHPNPKPYYTKNPSNFKISKYHGEEIVRCEFPDVTIIKASDIYGSEDRFLKTFAHSWRHQAKFYPLYANGLKTIKQPVFVSDVAQGIINAIKDPDTKGKVYQAVGPNRYMLSELTDWIHAVMRKDADWGYKRYDVKWDPLFPVKVNLTNLLSPAYPLGYLSWELLEKEATTDIVKRGVPTLEDLGVSLTPMEHQVPWELRPYRAHLYYMESVGEFPAPPPPKVYTGDKDVLD